MANWKGSISFGLIYIPVTLSPAAVEETISFNQLHRECKKRIKYKKVCPGCDEDVDASEIVKGYEYEKDKYVIFEESDFEKLKSARDKSITIEQFVDASEIDPVYYQRSYYVTPAGAEKAFSLLTRAMSESGRTGVAKCVLSDKENLIALRVQGKDMLLSTLFFASEIRKSPAPDLKAELNPKEIKLARDIIESMTEPFSPENFRDEYRDKLMKAIELKIKGQEITAVKEEVKGKTIDLMDALQASLAAAKKPRQRITQ